MRKLKSNNAIDELKSMMRKESIERAEVKAQDMLFKIKLSDLRKEAGLKQQDIESFSQSGLSKIESRSDMKISTLREYLHSIGMELEIRARKINIEKTAKKKEYVLLKG
jgi:hypothetical protein